MTTTDRLASDGLFGELSSGLAGRNRSVGDGSMGSLDLQACARIRTLSQNSYREAENARTKVAAQQVGTLLSDKEGRRIGVGAEVILRQEGISERAQDIVLHKEGRTGQIDKSQTLRF